MGQSWWDLPPNWKIWVKLDHFPELGVKQFNVWNHHLVEYPLFRIPGNLQQDLLNAPPKPECLITLATYLGVPFNFWWKDLDSVGLRVSIPELPSNYCLPAGSRFSASGLKIYCWYLPSRASPVWGSLIFEGTRCKEVPWPKLLVIVENDHFVSLRMLSVKNPVLNHIKPLFLVGCSFGKGCLGWPMTHDWKWVNHDFETHDMPTKWALHCIRWLFLPATTSFPMVLNKWWLQQEF